MKTQNNLENRGVSAQFHCLQQKIVGIKYFIISSTKKHNIFCEKRRNLSA